MPDEPDEPELPLPEEAPKKKLSLDFDPAVVGYPAAGERKAAAAKPKRNIKWGKLLGTTALGALALVIVIGAVAVFTLPGCLKRRCIEAAASRGVTLTIDDVQLGAGRFSLVNVGASSPELPGMRVTAPEIEVEMSGLEPKLVTARKAEIVVDGAYETVKDAIAKWRDAHKGTVPGDGAGGSGSQTRLVLDGAHLAWSRPFGAHVKLDILEMHLEAGRNGNGTADELQVLSPHAVLELDGAKIGPWRIAHDREGADARSRISFDPQLTDGPAAIFVMSGDRIASIDVTIPRTQLTNVGLSPELFGLPQGSGTQLDANIHFAHAVANRTEARATLGLYAIKAAAVPTPLDAKLDVSMLGDGAGAEMKKGSLSVGPLTGAVVGNLKVFDDGIRIDLGWKAGPLACTAFALGPPSAPGSPAGLGDLGTQLAQLAHATGIAKVTGDVRMEGTLTFDSRDFDHAKVAFSSNVTCDVSLFGANTNR